MKYTVIRTEIADSQIRQIILRIAENFGKAVALEKLGEMEKNLKLLESNPNIGGDPHYLVLKRQGYKVLVLEKNLVFYKINEKEKQIIIYAVVDHRQDYLNIIRGL